ncbi:MAG: hypothetical protein PF513_06340 [Tenericutes bacterium]|nr:hypothetical protein [Mycoplasmatota bacterium]
MNNLDKSIKNIKFRDLAFVILYAIVLSIMFGILIGLIDSLIVTQISFSLSFIFFFLSSRWLGKQVRKLYDYPNIYYVIITGIGLFIQASIILVLQMFARQGNIIEHPELFLNELVYIETMIYMFRDTFANGIFNSLNYFITYLLYGVGIYIGIRETY